MYDFLFIAKALSDEIGIRIPSFGHAGDGNLHIYLCRDNLDKADFEAKKMRTFDALYAYAAEIGGFVSGEHGIGYAKRQYLANQMGGTQMSLMRGIKHVFDEKGLLNPHKVI